MVHIIHEHRGRRVEGEAAGADRGMLLLTSKKGSFFSLCPERNATKYNGLVQYDAELQAFVKSVDSIRIDGEATVIVNRISSVERRYADGAVETFRLSSKALHYRLDDYEGELLLDLDMRRLDDEEGQGRIYDVRQEGETLLVSYAKHADDSCQKALYEQFLAIHGIPEGSFRAIGEWQERHFSYDARRGDSSRLWVYRLGSLLVDGSLALVFARSSSAEKALAKAREVVEQEQAILKGLDTYAKNAYKEATLEEELSLASLDALVTKLKGEGFIGVMAGLPWFTQRWSRDELVSVGALILAGQYGLAKDILIRYYELLDHGLRAHYPSGGLPAADALGWLALRTEQLLLALERAGILAQYFTRLGLAWLRDRMAQALERLPRDGRGLVMNGAGETWMDAAVSGDDRSGCRVEIQAGALAGYRLLSLLEKRTRKLLPLLAPQWKAKERELAAKAKKAFLVDGRLQDGADDARTRPNIFLACSLYPQLLSAKEWRGVFDAALPSLWLAWGGLASIERNDPLFQERYTGADNRSYHRGDSWYWVNALAAICLAHLDPERYGETVGKLRDACLRDLLFQGAVGHCSELSSAKEQEWGGCFSQAWSAALLYELLLNDDNMERK